MKYGSSSGLLLSKLDTGNYGYVYKYDGYGRLLQTVAPTGHLTFLSFNLTKHGGNIKERYANKLNTRWSLTFLFILTPKKIIFA